MRAESSKVLVVRRLLFKFRVGWYAERQQPPGRVPVQLGPRAAADEPGKVGDFASEHSGGKFTTHPLCQAGAPGFGKFDGNLDPPPSDRKVMGWDQAASARGPSAQTPSGPAEGALMRMAKGDLRAWDTGAHCPAARPLSVSHRESPSRSGPCAAPLRSMRSRSVEAHSGYTANSVASEPKLSSKLWLSFKN